MMTFSIGRPEAYVLEPGRSLVRRQDRRRSRIVVDRDVGMGLNRFATASNVLNEYGRKTIAPL
jgi:hypothetical protein